jgi:hypothetical protein
MKLHRLTFESQEAAQEAATAMQDFIVPLVIATVGTVVIGQLMYLWRQQGVEK